MAAMFVNKTLSRSCLGICRARSKHLRESFGINRRTCSKDASKSSHTELYPEHIPTTHIQKALLTVGSAVGAILDPFRHDLVALLGETTGWYAAKNMRDKMMSDPDGTLILREQPRISSDTVDLTYLENLPDDTFGHAYFRFLKDNGVSPDTRAPVHFVDDPELAYVIQRYREVHDLIHTLLGMPTNMVGEVAVKWVEAIQTGLPMCYAGALAGPIRFRPKQREKYLNSYLQWAIECGHNAKYLMNVYYEKRWEQNLESLRTELNVIKPPEET